MSSLYEARLRHARYFESVLAAAQESCVRGAEWQKRGVEQFDSNELNIMTALAWATARAGLDDATDLLCIRYLSLGSSFFTQRQHLNERVRSLEAGLAAARRLRQLSFESLFLHQLSNAYFMLGDYERAVELGRAANAVKLDFREMDEHVLLSSILCSPYGEAVRVIGEVNRKEAFYELADALHRLIEGGEAPSPAREAASGSIELAQEALRGFQESGDVTGEAASLASLGAAYAEACDTTRAIETYLRARHLYRELKDKRSEADTISSLVRLYAASNDSGKSLELAEEMLKLYRQVCDASGEMLSLATLGVLHSSAGDYSRALEFHRSAVDIARRLDDTNFEAVILSQIGLCCEQLGEAGRMLAATEEKPGIPERDDYHDTALSKRLVETRKMPEP